MASARLNFLITGAGRGIGRGLSRELLSRGHRVFLVDSNAEELEHTVHFLAKTYKAQSDFDSLMADVRDPGLVKLAASQAEGLFGGRLDCLVNNAAYTGGVGPTKLEDMTACLQMLAKARGCVIHVSSTRAFQSEPHHEGYSTTKAGLLGMAQSMAVSLAERGIRVNSILPGWIHVVNECKAADEAGIAWEEGLSEGDSKWHLTGRVGNVEDMVKAVLYLAESNGVTGAELVVDGGVTRKMVYPE